jgi:hypothetical protein
MTIDKHGNAAHAFFCTFQKITSYMKKFLFLSLFATTLFAAVESCAQQDKSKRPSPPAVLNYTNNGVNITMEYSQPSLKGRTIGKELAPFGQVWRTGANEATTFEVNKDVTIEGQPLPAGKYSVYSIPGEDEWTIIFNKTWKQWGTVYKQEEDALRVKVKPSKAETTSEQMTFNTKGDKILLHWGDTQVGFTVK